MEGDELTFLFIEDEYIDIIKSIDIILKDDCNFNEIIITFGMLDDIILSYKLSFDGSSVSKFNVGNISNIIILDSPFYNYSFNLKTVNFLLDIPINSNYCTFEGTVNTLGITINNIIDSGATVDVISGDNNINILAFNFKDLIFNKSINALRIDYKKSLFSDKLLSIITNETNYNISKYTSSQITRGYMHFYYFKVTKKLYLQYHESRGMTISCSYYNENNIQEILGESLVKIVNNSTIEDNTQGGIYNPSINYATSLIGDQKINFTDRNVIMSVSFDNSYFYGASCEIKEDENNLIYTCNVCDYTKIYDNFEDKAEYIYYNIGVYSKKQQIKKSDYLYLYDWELTEDEYLDNIVVNKIYNNKMTIDANGVYIFGDEDDDNEEFDNITCNTSIIKDKLLSDINTNKEDNGGDKVAVYVMEGVENDNGNIENTIVEGVGDIEKEGEQSKEENSDYTMIVPIVGSSVGSSNTTTNNNVLPVHEVPVSKEKDQKIYCDVNQFTDVPNDNWVTNGIVSISPDDSIIIGTDRKTMVDLIIKNNIIIVDENSTSNVNVLIDGLSASTITAFGNSNTSQISNAAQIYNQLSTDNSGTSSSTESIKQVLSDIYVTTKVDKERIKLSAGNDNQVKKKQAKKKQYKINTILKNRRSTNKNTSSQSDQKTQKTGKSKPKTIVVSKSSLITNENPIQTLIFAGTKLEEDVKTTTYGTLNVFITTTQTSKIKLIEKEETESDENKSPITFENIRITTPEDQCLEIVLPDNVIKKPEIKQLELFDGKIKFSGSSVSQLSNMTIILYKDVKPSDVIFGINLNNIKFIKIDNTKKQKLIKRYQTLLLMLTLVNKNTDEYKLMLLEILKLKKEIANTD